VPHFLMLLRRQVQFQTNSIVPIAEIMGPSSFTKIWFSIEKGRSTGVGVP
jgi:hypothetical protein